MWLAVDTDAGRAACRSRGVFGVGNGRRRVLVRDLPIAGVPVVLVWAKRTWRCCETLCGAARGPRHATRSVCVHR